MADKLLKSIKFPTLPDRYVIGDSTLTEEGAAAEAKAVGEALATKADTKGTYEDLIVGGAEQLMADGYETDKEPYLFRPTGGSADVGNREYLDKIVGGTVAWNQLCPISTKNSTTINGVTFTNNGDGSWTVSGTATAFTTYEVVGASTKRPRVYALFGCPSGGSSSTYNLALRGAGSDIQDTGNGVVWDASATTARYKSVSIVINANTVISTPITFRPQLFDLTALFNPTIADYIYSLEQSQAGAGVAWFRNYFPNDYYPYDPGTLRSVEGVSAHETVGFNQFDKTTAVNGYIDNDNGQVSGSSPYKSTDYIKVVPNTSYYIKTEQTGALWGAWYDADKNYISGMTAYQNTVKTAPSNAHYVRATIASSQTGNIDTFCINLSDPSRNGEYEPYQKHTYPLDSSLTLRGVPKLVDGKLAFDGDVYPPSGEVQRRYKEDTFDGDSVTSVSTVGDAPFARVVASELSTGVIANMVCNAYTPSVTSANKNIVWVSSSQQVVRIFDNRFTDLATAKSILNANPVTLVYELATPTTETADGYEHYQICDPSGTEKFVTDSIVPVGHETRYPHDLKKKIETAPDSPSADGTYLMKRSGGKNSYMALPSTPSANGSYVLTVTVSGGTASYSWTAKE